VDLGKGDEDLNITFPITIATVPFRIPNCNKTPQIFYSEYLLTILMYIKI